MANVILCNISDNQRVIEEERVAWTYEVLLALDVPEEVLEDISNVDEYRYLMDELGIEVELNSDGEIDIYKKQMHYGATEEMTDWLPPTKDHLVAQWKKPTYVRRVEGKETYYEIHLNEWSILNMRHGNE